MELNKHFSLLILSVLVLLGGCSFPAQQETSDILLKECLYVYKDGTLEPTRNLCDSNEDCVASYKKLLEPEFERFDLNGTDPTYQGLRKLLNPNNYQCKPTELVPLLQSGNEIACSGYPDCYPLYLSHLWENVIFCEDGICKVTKYSRKGIQHAISIVGLNFSQPS